MSQLLLESMPARILQEEKELAIEALRWVRVLHNLSLASIEDLQRKMDQTQRELAVLDKAIAKLIAPEVPSNG